MGMKELKHLSIDERINARMQAYVRLYVTNILYDGDYSEILWNIIPSNMKHGGYKNTCYDYNKAA